MPAPLLLLAVTAGHADVLRATLRVDGERVELVDAVRLPGEAGPSPGRGALEVVDAAGRVLGAAELPPLAAHRSVIAPDGLHETVRVDHVLVRVELPWPAGAAALRLHDRVLPLADPGLRRGDAARLAVPVLESGPSSDRLDLVFLSEGYTADRAAAFEAHVDEVVDHLLQLEPWSGYAGLFNVWRVFVPSRDGGIDELEGRDRVASAFECWYGCGLGGTATSRLVCCDEEAVLGAVQAHAPYADGVMVLLDSPIYGGSGGLTYSTAYTGEPLALQVAAHELGHTLIGLWDEYPYGLEPDPHTTYVSPNCSPTDVDPPWTAWIDGGPIEWLLWHDLQDRKEERPSRWARVDCDGRPGAAAPSTVCAYPTCSFGSWVRPTRSACMMNQLGQPLCPACREAIVRALYGAVGAGALVRSADPPVGARLRPEAGERIPFTIDAVGPDDGLTWTWTSRGRVLHEGPDFVLDGGRRVCGDLTLTLEDPTPFVRGETARALLAQSVSWDVRTGPCCGCATGGPTTLAPALLVALAALRRRRHA